MERMPLSLIENKTIYDQIAGVLNITCINLLSQKVGGKIRDILQCAVALKGSTRKFINLFRR